MTNILIGKTITKVMIAEDKMAIAFSTPEGDVVAKCDADCCSHTWIENVDLPVNGFPATCSVVEDIELNVGADDQNGELRFYGCKVVTDKGDIIIDYRNESNGYYGGSLNWPDEYYYGGVFGQNTSKEEWIEVA